MEKEIGFHLLPLFIFEASQISLTELLSLSKDDCEFATVAEIFLGEDKGELREASPPIGTIKGVSELLVSYNAHLQTEMLVKGKLLQDQKSQKRNHQKITWQL